MNVCKCRNCGRVFTTSRVLFYCDSKCRNQYEARQAYERAVQASLAESTKRKIEKEQMLARLRKRDAEYAARFPATARGARRGRIASGHVADKSFYLPIV